MIERAGVEHAELLANEAGLILAGLPEYTECPFDLQHTISMLSMYLSLPSIGCFFSTQHGKINGFIMCVLSAPFYSPRIESSEMFFWVHEDFRNTRLGAQLIKTQEEWSIQNGATNLCMSASSGYKTASVVKYYNRQGYRTTGVTCTKGV